jgi:hypothetical protein
VCVLQAGGVPEHVPPQVQPYVVQVAELALLAHGVTVPVHGVVQLQ